MDRGMRGSLLTAQAIPWGASPAQFTKEKGCALSLLGCFPCQSDILKAIIIIIGFDMLYEFGFATLMRIFVGNGCIILFI